MTLEFWDRISAVFNPKIRDTLKPGVESLIGKRFVFHASFVIDDDRHPYAGQQTFECRDPEWAAVDGLVWAPAEDLDDPEPVPCGELRSIG